MIPRIKFSLSFFLLKISHGESMCQFRLLQVSAPYRTQGEKFYILKWKDQWKHLYCPHNYPNLFPSVHFVQNISQSLSYLQWPFVELRPPFFLFHIASEKKYLCLEEEKIWEHIYIYKLVVTNEVTKTSPLVYCCTPSLCYLGGEAVDRWLSQKSKKQHRDNLVGQLVRLINYWLVKLPVVKLLNY